MAETASAVQKKGGAPSPTSKGSGAPSPTSSGSGKSKRPLEVPTLPLRCLGTNRCIGAFCVIVVGIATAAGFVMGLAERTDIEVISSLDVHQAAISPDVLVEEDDPRSEPEEFAWFWEGETKIGQKEVSEEDNQKEASGEGDTEASEEGDQKVASEEGDEKEASEEGVQKEGSEDGKRKVSKAAAEKPTSTKKKTSSEAQPPSGAKAKGRSPEATSGDARTKSTNTGKRKDAGDAVASAVHSKKGTPPTGREVVATTNAAAADSDHDDEGGGEGEEDVGEALLETFDHEPWDAGGTWDPEKTSAMDTGSKQEEVKEDVRFCKARHQQDIDDDAVISMMDLEVEEVEKLGPAPNGTWHKVRGRPRDARRLEEIEASEAELEASRSDFWWDRLEQLRRTHPRKQRQRTTSSRVARDFLGRRLGAGNKTWKLSQGFAKACAAGGPLVQCTNWRGSPRHCHWCGPRANVFIYDHLTLGYQARKVLGDASSWWPNYTHWSEHPLELLHQTDPDYPDPFVALELRAAIESRWQDTLQVVTNPKDADILLWLVWDFALCKANHTPAEEWEFDKRRYKQSCPLMWRLWRWLQSTSLWERRDGKDFVFLMADPEGIEAGRRRHRKDKYYWNSPKKGWKDEMLRMVKGVTRRSKLIVVEDRRMMEKRGRSCAIPVPYYVKVGGHTAAEVSGPRPRLVTFLGSVEDLHHTCEICKNGIHPRSLRGRLVEQLKQECQEGECFMQVLDQSVGLDRNAPAKMARLNDGLGVQGSLKDATFCPIPRGDSGATKRFYSSIVAGCIPVLLSDHLPRPFSAFIDYASFAITIREQQFMSEEFSLLRLLRSIPEDKVEQLQRGLRQARSAFVYSRGCSLPWACQWQYEDPRRRRSCPYASSSPSDVFDHLVLQIMRTFYDPVHRNFTLEGECTLEYPRA
mmetsp:Transcript_64524/g.154103  ORF Transcript_64524/g.154103 Transcript_64524/m.154103 type:complete len:920 (+) Transcript_64524:181-2940(+)